MNGAWFLCDGLLSFCGFGRLVVAFGVNSVLNTKYIVYGCRHSVFMMFGINLCLEFS